jgi:sec-independent protein translocase protein TatB
MFNIGFSELLIIGLLALVLLGPEQLPSALRSLARVIRDFRRATNSFKEQIDPELTEVARDLRDALHDDVTLRPKRPAPPGNDPERFASVPDPQAAQSPNPPAPTSNIPAPAEPDLSALADEQDPHGMPVPRGIRAVVPLTSRAPETVTASVSPGLPPSEAAGR